MYRHRFVAVVWRQRYRPASDDGALRHTHGNQDRADYLQRRRTCNERLHRRPDAGLYIQNETQKWAKVIKAAGIRPE